MAGEQKEEDHMTGVYKKRVVPFSDTNEYLPISSSMLTITLLRAYLRLCRGHLEIDGRYSLICIPVTVLKLSQLDFEPI